MTEVIYIDHMGDDLRGVNAARVSFKKASSWGSDGDEYEGVVYQNIDEKEVCLKERDDRLVKYLAKNGHWTPFSHPQITMLEKVPIFVARQRFKHVVGFTYNEVSRRYVDDPPEFYVPDEWRSRPEGGIKQGSGNDVIEGIHPWYEQHLKDSEELYNDMINNGVAPEQARMVLPQSMYTEYYVTGSLAAWARAYKLRSDSHAQKEIQDLAAKWDEIIRPMFPVSWSALVDTE